MEDVVVKQRYQYNKPRSRKKRKHAKDGSPGEIMKIQFFLSVLIFIVISCIKVINIPATNFITSKIKWVLSWNIDINDFYEQIDSIIKGGSRLGKLGESLGRIVTGNAKGNVKENEERYKVEEDTEENMNENMEENMDEGTAEDGEDLEARDEVF
ncbi:MAG: hypothetical protein GX754_07705 [Clostridiaceae bacterium]|nr:hypothetical protein [Clostridiaceae bacterium]